MSQYEHAKGSQAARDAQPDALANPGRTDTLPRNDSHDGVGETERHVQVVIETPRGSRIKYKFDEDLRTFTLKSLLPAGMVFPHNFGFVPRTLGGDGDPLDVLVLLEEPVFPGCMLTVRVIGVMEVEDTVNGRTQRNDRLLAVTDCGDVYSAMQDLTDIPEVTLQQLDEFFTQYHKVGGKTSRTLACRDAKCAGRLLDESLARLTAA